MLLAWASTESFSLQALSFCVLLLCLFNEILELEHTRRETYRQLTRSLLRFKLLHNAYMSKPLKNFLTKVTARSLDELMLLAALPGSGLLTCFYYCKGVLFCH